MSHETETGTLRHFLDEQRDHVLGILEGLSEGLSEEQLRRPTLPSGWHCLGMVKHLALADEHYWFRSVVGGESFGFFPQGPNAEWQLDPGESAEDVFGLYREEMAVSGSSSSGCQILGSPGALSRAWRGRPPAPALLSGNQYAHGMISGRRCDRGRERTASDR